MQISNRAAFHIGPSVITVTGRMAQNLRLLLRIPQWLLSMAAFKSQQIMLASTMTKIFAVFVVGIPLCLVGGVLYSWTSGRGVINGFINAYGALYKIPGEPPFLNGQTLPVAPVAHCTYVAMHVYIYPRWQVQMSR